MAIDMGERTMGEKKTRAVQEGLDEESLAVFDLLRTPELSPIEVKRIKAVAVELLEAVKSRIKEIEDWENREATRGRIRSTIRDFLWRKDSGLPIDRNTEIAVIAHESYVTNRGTGWDHVPLRHINQIVYKRSE